MIWSGSQILPLMEKERGLPRVCWRVGAWRSWCCLAPAGYLRIQSVTPRSSAAPCHSSDSCYKSVLYFRKGLALFTTVRCSRHCYLVPKFDFDASERNPQERASFLFISRTIQEKKDINSTFSPFSVIEPLNTKHPA